MSRSYIFSNLAALAELPYFELREGKLYLREEFGPVIDMHAHLALSFVFPPKVDLWRLWPETKYYLPADKPFSLEVYTSRNFSPEDLKRCKRDLTLFGLTPWGMRQTHTAANLLEDMKRMQIERTLLLAIDQVAISRNSETYLEHCGERREFVVFGSVHPFTPNLEKRLDKLVQLGAKGIKFHPAVQAVRPDHPRARRLFRLCGERKLPVFFHCGPVGIEPYLGRVRSQVRLYKRPIEECPHTTFILGHSGALQMELGLKLAQDYPNVYLELVCQPRKNMEKIFTFGPKDRIFFGSDWPFYHQAVTMVKVLLATEGAEEMRRKVLYENGKAFLKALEAEHDQRAE